MRILLVVLLIGTAIAIEEHEHEHEHDHEHEHEHDHADLIDLELDEDEHKTASEAIHQLTHGHFPHHKPCHNKPHWVRPTLQLPKFGSKAILAAELKKEGILRFTSSYYKQGIVKRIVLFRLKDTVTAKKALEVKRQFFALKAFCKRDGQPYIESIDGGYQYGGEELDGGFQYAFILTFKSEGDRNYFVGQPIVTDLAFYDPAHQKFKEFVTPFLADDGVLVFDFRA